MMKILEAIFTAVFVPIASLLGEIFMAVLFVACIVLVIQFAVDILKFLRDVVKPKEQPK